MNRDIYRCLIAISILLLVYQGMGQRVLIVEKTGRFRHYSYEVGDQIALETRTNEVMVRGPVTSILDTALIVDGEWEIGFSEIESIRRKRGFFVFLQEVFLKGGIPFIFIVGINRAINHEYPVLDGTAIYVGGGLILAGVAVSPLKTRKIDMTNGRWNLKALDYDTYR